MVRFGMPRPGSQLCYSFSLLLFVLLGAGTASTFGSDSTHLLREDIYKAAAIGNGNGNTNGVETLRSISESASLLRRSIPILIQRLGDDSASVRGMAAIALGNLGPSAREAIPALMKAFPGEETEVQAYIASALGKMGSATSSMGIQK